MRLKTLEKLIGAHRCVDSYIEHRTPWFTVTHGTPCPVAKKTLNTPPSLLWTTNIPQPAIFCDRAHTCEHKREGVNKPVRNPTTCLDVSLPHFAVNPTHCPCLFFNELAWPFLLLC